MGEWETEEARGSGERGAGRGRGPIARKARQMQRLGEYGSRADEEDGRRQHLGRCETHGSDDSIGFETDYLQYRIAIQADAKHPRVDIASNRQGFKAVVAKKQASACKPRSRWPFRARKRSWPKPFLAVCLHWLHIINRLNNGSPVRARTRAFFGICGPTTP